MPIPKTEKAIVERRSLHEEVASRLRRAILNGEFAPGERLSDNELQAWLGVSRVPLREALNDLVREGFVETRAQQYTRVALPDSARAADLMQAVGVLLGGIARIAVQTAADESLQALIRQVRKLAKCADGRDAHGFGEENFRLVDSLVGLCPNPVLVGATRNTVDGAIFHLTRGGLGREPDWERARDAFNGVAEAIESRDHIATELAVESAYGL